MITTPTSNPPVIRHKRWVKITHWTITLSFLALTFSGFIILMCHPRLYWGEVGNDLTPALFELPVSRNYKHGGWENTSAFFDNEGSPVSASRTYEIFNQNGWGRSLHFLAAWFLVITGLVYLLTGIFSGHVRKNLWPRVNELTGSMLKARSHQPFSHEVSYGNRRATLRSPAKECIPGRYLFSFPIGGNDRLNNVSCDYSNISVPVKNVLWRTIRPDHPFLCILCAGPFPDRACGDGDQDRIQTTNTLHDN